MLEIVGSMWDEPSDAVCVLTNGATKMDGEAVMGLGTALQAKERYPDLPRILGDRLRSFGNHVYDLGVRDGRIIYSFPTKHHWRDPLADEKLIARSCAELLCLVRDRPELKKVVIPRPGCGVGGLPWKLVRPIMEAHLPADTFVVISQP